MKTQPLIFIIALLTILAPSSGWAEDAAVAVSDAAPTAASETAQAAKPSPYMTTRQELWELKQRDPEAFKAKITELRNSAQKRLDGLKETDPEAYQRVIERRQKRIQPRFERFRDENPQAYERIEGHREGLIQKRFDRLQQSDPAKFQEIQQRRQAWRAEHPNWQAKDWQSPRPWRDRPGTQFKALDHGGDFRGPGLLRSDRPRGPESWKDENRPGSDRPAPRRGGPGRQDGR